MSLADRASEVIKKKFSTPWQLQQVLYAIFAAEPQTIMPTSQVGGGDPSGQIFPPLPPEEPLELPFFDFATMEPEVVEPAGDAFPFGVGSSHQRHEVRKVQKWFRVALLGQVQSGPNEVAVNDPNADTSDFYQVVLYPNGPNRAPGLKGEPVSVRQMSVRTEDIEPGTWAVPVLRQLLLEFRDHTITENDQVVRKWQDVVIIEQNHQMDVREGGGSGGGLLGRVVSGSDDSYQVTLYPNGPDGEVGETVTVIHLATNLEQTIPADEWVVPVLSFTNADGVTSYYMKEVIAVASGLLGRVVSGEGDTYQVDLYPDGPDGEASAEPVEVRILDIADDETLPADYWIVGILQFADGSYIAKVPVWEDEL